MPLPPQLIMSTVGVARAGLQAVAANNAVKVPGLAYKAMAALMDSLPRDVARTIMRFGTKRSSSNE